ncbi:MAG: metalloregulator ArsR/SmtB family transcription factor [Candidatus Moranbacteria bacterium]|nr:metalloregulator ArsR/SmtB family transcription factor [Candidatus Moranbacteria bacterium]
MTKNEEKLHKYVKLLADKNRYKIILSLAKGEECVCFLSEKLKIEQTLLSHHLRILREEKMIKVRKTGTWAYYSLDREKFAEMEKIYKELLSAKNISDEEHSHNKACK